MATLVTCCESWALPWLARFVQRQSRREADVARLGREGVARRSASIARTRSRRSFVTAFIGLPPRNRSASAELLNAQIVLRNNRRLQTAMRSSRLPAVKTLAEFDFAFQPSIKREQIESLHELGFVDRAENVVLLGPPGVGKTHLAISLAVTAAESGRRVYYGTLAALIESLTEAKTGGNLARRLKVLTHPALLVVDEIGYLPVNQEGAMLFFQLINARHERASTVLTSNKGFEEWGSVLGDEVMAAALIDRLLHHCHVVNIRGNSFRMRAHQDLLRSRHADADGQGRGAA